MLTRIETKKGPWKITDPNWPVYVPVLDANGTYTSDTFSASGALAGSATDAALGGHPRTWEGATGAWSRTDGRLSSVGAGSVGVIHPLSSVTVEATIVTPPTTDAIYLEAAAVDAPSAARTDAARIQIMSAGNLCLMRRRAVGGHASGALVAYKAGDRLGLRVQGGRMVLTINGVDRNTFEDTTDWQAQGTVFAGLTTVKATGAVIDDFVVRGVI